MAIPELFWIKYANIINFPEQFKNTCIFYVAEYVIIRYSQAIGILNVLKNFKVHVL